MALPTPLVYIPGVQARDLTGNTTPAWSGTAAYTTDKNARIALDHTGNEFVTVGALALPEGAPQSLACWAYVNAGGTADIMIGTRENTIGALTFQTEAGATGWRPLARIAAIAQASSTADLSFSAWHHVALVYDGSTLVYYADGAAVGTDASLTGVWDATTTTRIGARLASGSGSQYMDGFLADVRIYDVELTAAQASELFHLNRPLAPAALEPYSVQSDTTDTALEGAWLSADPDTRLTADDASSNAVDGTPAGGTLFEYDGSAQFDGTDDEIDLGSQAAPTPITVAFSVKLLAGTAERVITWGKTAVRLRSTEVEWWADVGEALIDLDATLTVGEWHRIVITQTGTTAEIWVNGTSIGSETTVAIDTAAGSSYLGSNNTQFGNLVLADVSVWSRAWTDAQIVTDWVEHVPDASLLLRADPIHGDTSRYRRAITWAGATRNVGDVDFANGGITVTSFGPTTYLYWYDAQDGTAATHWGTNGANVHENGVTSTNVLPVTLTATGFGGITARMSHIEAWDEAKATSFIRARYNTTIREK